MFRRFPLVAFVAAILLAACGSQPVTPIDDPTEILTRSLDAFAGAKTVHLKADVSGQVALDITGTGAAAPLDLSGTTIEGDLDIAGGKAQLMFEVPALLGIGGELIQVGQDSYLKISGPIGGGDTYLHMTQSGGGPIAMAGDPRAAVAELKKGLAGLSSPPTKGADEKCGDKDCYKVSLALTAEEMAGLTSAIPGLSGPGTVDVLVRKDDLRPARVSMAAGSADEATLTANVELTNYDAGVSIAAPPADQVREGGLDGLIPGLPGLDSLAP